MRYRNLLLIIVLTLFLSTTAYADRVDGGGIRDANLHDRNDLYELTDLLKDKNILHSFAVRERIIGESYEELQRLAGDIKDEAGLAELSVLVKELMHVRKATGLFVLSEQIDLESIPQKIQSPFYYNEHKQPSIVDLNQNAEALYFYNTVLPYSPHALTQQDDLLWANPALSDSFLGDIPSPYGEPIMSALFDKKKAVSQIHGFFRLQDDKMTNFVRDARQWYKGYEENLMNPVPYEDVVFLRNEYTLFCLDKETWRLVWSYTYDQSGREQYQTVRPIHHNAFGYELAASEKTVFSEYNGTFVALDIGDILQPEFKWSVDLGEYTVCAEPIVAGSTVVVGLVNARMEVWFCGLDATTGNFLWTSYVGLSTYLSPVSSVSLIGSERVYIGTNHGFLISLMPSSGEICWVKKFKSNQYSYFDYWFGHYSKYKAVDRGSISYDTQFLSAGAGGKLYYKPRESSFLYTLDAATGKSHSELLIDSQKYLLLGVFRNGKAVFYSKDSLDGEVHDVRVIDLETGEIFFKEKIESSTIQGVVPADDKTLVFFGDKKLFFIREIDSKYVMTHYRVPVDGWLVSFFEKYACLASGRDLYSLDILPGHSSLSGYDSAIKHELEIREDIFAKLERVTQPRCARAEKKVLREQIVMAVRNVHDFDIAQFMEFYYKHDTLLNAREWDELMDVLIVAYGDTIVSYDTISVRFDRLISYLRGTTDKRTPNSLREGVNNVHRGDPYRLFGEQVRVIPVTTVDSVAVPDFYLVQNFSHQLLCVNEDHTIRWSRPIYNDRLGNLNVKYATEEERGQIENRQVVPYLFGNTLIVNDRLNVFAIDVVTGEYLWSSATDDVEFEPSVADLYFWQWNKTFKRYLQKEEQLSAVLNHGKFYNDSFVIIRGKTLRVLDPSTGIVTKQLTLPVSSVSQLIVTNNELYVISYGFKKILKLNDRFEITRKITLPFAKKLTKFPQFAFLRNSIGVLAESVLYILDSDTGKILAKQEISKSDDCLLDVCDDSLLLVRAFDSVERYVLNGRTLDRLWRYRPQQIDPVPYYVHYTFADHYEVTEKYLIWDKYMILPYSYDGKFFVSVVDLATGSELFHDQIPEVGGMFQNLSLPLIMDGVMYFVMTTGCNDNYEEIKATCERLNKGLDKVDQVEFDFALVRVNVSDHTVELLSKGKKSGFGFLKSRLAEMPHSYVVSISDFELWSRRKDAA